MRYRKFRNHIILNHFKKQRNLITSVSPDHFVTLQNRIDILGRHIDRDYCFLDLPDYGNIGDHLIYEGSLDFLSTLPYRKKYEASAQSFEELHIGPKDIIILQGGGNFGDLWPGHQNFREQITTSYRKNKIIIFPQTIFFQEHKNLKKAVSVFSAHPDLTICTRDHRSYELAVNNFTKNTILLLPDMASYIQYNVVKKFQQTGAPVLFMERHDKELKKSITLPYIKNLHNSDWPSIEFNYFNYLPDKYKQHKFYLNEGIFFLSNYNLVISTRLHGSILAALLGIPVILLDNVYGKNKTYYETWMKDISNFYFAKDQKELKIIIEKNFPQIIL